MNPSAGALAPRHEGSAGRWLGWALALVAFVVVVPTVAGYLLLWSIGEAPDHATPLTWFAYAHWYGDRPAVRLRLAMTGFFAAAPVIAGVALMVRPKAPALHGAARFASRAEIARAGLLGEHGILLGKMRRRYLMLAGQQGVALAAPPRAGKGVGIVIPNALNWPGSLVCVDIKRENWDKTAGFRHESGQPCYLFDPLATDGRTARWNPLWYVPEDPSLRVSALQQIAEMLYPDPVGGDPFWMASARTLFMGIALYLFDTPGKLRTLGEILRQGMASDEEGFEEHWRRVVEGRQRGKSPLSRVCVQALYDAIKIAPLTGSGIRKTFTSRLDLWLNPILDQATSGNDFDLRTLRETPQSIYVAVRPDDLHRLRPVLNLFFQQAIGLQTRELPEQNPRLKHQILMLLDEFTALGRIPIMAESVSYLPGYNVRVLLVIQSPSQLREVYGQNNAETMMKSLAARIVFAPKDIPDAREISEELGYITVKAQSRSKATFWASHQHRTPTVNESDQRRALQLPQELKALGGHHAIIFYEGLPPILCRKVRYYNERVFRARLHPPPLPAPGFVESNTRAASVSVEDPYLAGGTMAPDEPDSPVGETEAGRPPEASDLTRVDELTLEDFVTPESASAALTGWDDKPAQAPMRDSELRDRVDAFIATLEK
jgi:type IV secretion system protein VirD4